MVKEKIKYLLYYVEKEQGAILKGGLYRNRDGN